MIDRLNPKHEDWCSNISLGNKINELVDWANSGDRLIQAIMQRTIDLEDKNIKPAEQTESEGIEKWCKGCMSDCKRYRTALERITHSINKGDRAIAQSALDGKES